MHKELNILLIVVLCYTYHPVLNAKTWNVGPNRLYTSPSKVSNLARDGDTVLIDAGVYTQDVCFWSAHHLLIKGINGNAHLKSEGKAAGQKAIWVIQGDSTIVENIEFSECKVPDKNGAGIRLEGTHLVVRNCYFHHNEDGILAGDNARSNVIIEYSEFSFNGFGDGLSHNLYINHVNSLTFRYNYSHDAKVGHLLKSRAHNNYIYYNRLSEENGEGSYEIDLPNGGLSVLQGNIIQQGINSQNSAIISYGKEGLSNPTAHELYLSHNTIINDKSNGTFVQLQNGTSLLFMLNNIFAGAGTQINGTPTTTKDFGNIKNTNINYFKFNNPSTLNYSLESNSPCYNKGFYSHILYPLLTPLHQYSHKANYVLRNTEFINDVGALESHFLSPFITPIEGSYGKDFIIVNYPNWSTTGILDGYCGSKSYWGHQGTDYVITGFEQMQQGLNILAAENGVVTAIKDGLFDMETISDSSKVFGNYICIKHPGNYYSYYAHLKKNSLQVKIGDSIQQGQVIGQVGCSGNCTDPHLHFELWWDSLQIIDPFQAPCGNSTSFWKNQIGYDTSFNIWKSGLQAGLTSLDSLRLHKINTLAFNREKDYYVSYWNLEYGLRKGDKSTLQWYNEAGIKVWQFDYTHTSDAWYYYYWSNVDTKTLDICKSCEVHYLINGVLKDKINFQVFTFSNNTDLESENIIIYNNYIKIHNSKIKNIDIYDMNGRLLVSQNITSLEKIDKPSLPNGIYFIRYTLNNLIHTLKFPIIN